MTQTAAGVRRQGRLPHDLAPRVAVAVPAAALLLALNHAGGLAFALALGLLGGLGQAELARMAGLPRAAALPGCLGVAAVPVLALYGEAGAAGVVAALALAAAAAAGRGRAAAVTAGGLAWLAACLAHAVLLRELDHGAGLVVDVLLATFLGDTAAHLFGSAFGRRRLAPAISPNKTVEGLVAGIVAGTAACWLAGALFQDWLSSAEALALGLACALAAPAGDLLESAVKRRAGVKDSGRLFGAHGGVLDRVDAAIVAAVAGYYVALGL